MKLNEKRILILCVIIYYLFLGISAYYYSTFIILVAGLSCWIIPILFKCLKINLTFIIYLFNFLFIFIANIIGSIWNGYAIAYFDKGLHFSSGLLISEFAFMIYVFLMKKVEFQKHEQILCLLFVNAINMMVGVYWEFLEFFCLIFLKHDAIHHYSSGVFDTMQDLIVAFIGGLIVSIYILLYFKKKRQSCWIREMKKFYKLNIH